jgi:hypothetical protein
VARGGAEVAAAARELGYPGTDVCMKPVVAAGSRGFHVISANVDARHQLLHERPGAMPLRLEDVERIIGDDDTELLVMELVTGLERTVDGYAENGRIVLGHPKTREAMRAGLAMRFETLDAPELMQVAETLVAGFDLEETKAAMPSVMWETPAAVAKVGVDAMANGTQVAIPGTVNRIAAMASQAAPKRLLLPVLAKQHPGLKK